MTDLKKDQPSEVSTQKDSSSLHKEFTELVEIVKKLRHPTEGCPWDLAQTQETLTPYIIEESYELVEAIESQSQKLIQEELGDLLFQVVLQAQVAADQNHFSLVDVISFLNHKMKQRHPHVFGELKTKDLEEIWNNWEKQKAKESSEKNEPQKSIFNLPKSLPALQTAYKIGVKTEAYKFDWTTQQEVFCKVSEEYEELKTALEDLEKNPNDALNQEATKHEIGDLLFSLAQLARHLEMEPEQILREANLRFRGRFETMIDIAQTDRESFRNLTPEQKEEFWRQAKIEHNSKE